MQQRKSFPASLRLSFGDNYSIHNCIFFDGTVAAMIILLCFSGLVTLLWSCYIGAALPVLSLAMTERCHSGLLTHHGAAIA